MKKIIPIALIIIRKLVTSLVTAVFCIASLYIFELTTGLKSSAILQNYLVVMFAVLLIYLAIIGSSVSVISDLATWKLPTLWRPIVAAVIHIGAIVLYLIFRGNVDAKVYLMYISIAALYWAIDELLRLLQQSMIKKMRSQKAKLETE